MPFYSSNRGSLDKLKPIEVVLDLYSFSDGENTVASDHELPTSTSRLMQNWEALSRGGMERSKGFSAIASGVPSIAPAGFIGTGLDDATSSGHVIWTDYVKASGSMDFMVQIVDETTAETADEFKWSRDDVVQASGIEIPDSSGYLLSDGVYITWASPSGHTQSDYWDISVPVYVDQYDWLMQADASGSQAVYGVILGDLVIYDGTEVKLEDYSAFEPGELCHGLSVNDQCWITNSVDNLKTKPIDGDLAIPADVPATACDRIYYHKFRLIAEGGSKTIYGSRVQPGFWNASDAWSLTNDAWNMTLPDETQGCVPNFPSGDDVTVFTERNSYSVYNFPNVSLRQIGSVGCSAPYSISMGNEGVYFVSKFPNIAVVLWNGVNFEDITGGQIFVDDIDFSKRIFGTYKDRKYYLFYASEETSSTYPNACKVYDALFRRWYTRTLNPALEDNFGYPAVMGFTNNELYIGSSINTNLYELDGDYTSDDGENTIAVYETKEVASPDFNLAVGGSFPIDGARIKLTKAVMVTHGTDGVITLSWTADRGRTTGSQTFDLNVDQAGDLLNTEFTMNESYLIGKLDEPDKTITKSFSNAAVGRTFKFQINNSASGVKPIIRSIRIHGIVIEQK